MSQNSFEKNKETRWFLTALLFAFIILKISGVIDWSWWWVLSPFLIPLSLVILLLLFTHFCVYMAKRQKKHDNKTK